MTGPFTFGCQIWPQGTTWAALRRAAILADQLGYDYLFTWDHFVSHLGDPDERNFECWQLLAAWAAVTERVRIGALVSGVTYRHPGVLAKMAATLDHVSDGRAILGIGGSWHEGEHKQLGIPFPPLGERLGRLREAVRVCRELWGPHPVAEFAGKYYSLTAARAEPKPIQKRLPILIGGAGEKTTLRIVARHADLWHVWSPPAGFGKKFEILKRHCAEVGRDVSEIRPLAGGWLAIRDTREAAFDVLKERAYAHGLGTPDPEDYHSPLHGTPESVAQRLAEYARNGARGYVAVFVPPFDEESMRRLLTEVGPRLRALLA
ncbi:MAG: TIGR03560 family F420-dependent LLM class oxidoreductase [Chloroflexi bacterium]|nr:TIGR03560 family F420-dependent LLM class oxidoreductase [Chloroflexota bacterium]